MLPIRDTNMYPIVSYHPNKISVVETSKLSPTSERKQTSSTNGVTCQKSGSLYVQTFITILRFMILTLRRPSKDSRKRTRKVSRQNSDKKSHNFSGNCADFSNRRSAFLNGDQRMQILKQKFGKKLNKREAKQVRKDTESPLTNYAKNCSQEQFAKVFKRANENSEFEKRDTG